MMQKYTNKNVRPVPARGLFSSRVLFNIFYLLIDPILVSTYKYFKIVRGLQSILSL